MILDRNIAWKRAVRRIPWTDFHLDTNNAGMHTGAPAIGEFSTIGVGGLLVGAAGDMFTTVDIVTPTLMDPREEIGVRVLWVNPVIGASTDDITWIVTYDQVDAGEAMITPATALDTTITEQEDVGGTALVYHQTARGIIDADTMDLTARSGIITWLVEADAMDFSGDEPAFLGLEIDYKPLLTYGPGTPEDEFSGRAEA